MTTPVVNLPNEVLDLHTLQLVRGAVARQRRLIEKDWARVRKTSFLGIEVVDYCAVGSVFKPKPGVLVKRDEFSEWAEKNDVDPITLAHIITVNDQDLKDVTPEVRRDAMLDWLDRAISIALGVSRAVEAFAEAEKTGERVHVVRPQLAEDVAEAVAA